MDIFPMLTSEEMEQFTEIERFILKSIPNFEKFLCNLHNQFGDRLVPNASDALGFVLQTFAEWKAKGIWQKKSFASEEHVFRYFRKCLKNAVFARYREEHEESEKARIRHINRTRRSRGKELLPEPVEGEQLGMTQLFPTAPIPIEPVSVEIDPLEKLEFEAIIECVLSHGLEKAWQLVMLKYGEKRSNAYIAEKLGYTEDSVRSLAPRYLKKIQDILRANGFTTNPLERCRRDWERMNNYYRALGFEVTEIRMEN